MNKNIGRRVFGCALLGALDLFASSDESVVAAVDEMESQLGLTLFGGIDLIRHSWVGARHTGTRHVSPGVATDGAAICWSIESNHEDPRTVPFLTITTLDGVREIEFPGYSAGGSAVSAGGKVILVGAAPLSAGGDATLLKIQPPAEPGSSAQIEDLSSRLPVTLPTSVSEDGRYCTLFVQDGVFAVRRVGDGGTVYQKSGLYPRLSPDGNHVAFLDGEDVYLHTIESESTQRLKVDHPVKGLGAWSPNSRFLLVGVRAGFIVRRTDLVAVDVVRGNHGAIKSLDAEDFGLGYCWIRKDLVAR